MTLLGWRNLALGAGSVLLVTGLTGCGGGGGGGGGGGSSGSVLYYPYETVFGTVCSNSTSFGPSPGCTFNRDGTRVKVTQDRDYNRFGRGSDDMWYVEFFSDGTADVYNSAGVFQYTKATSTFAGWVSGNVIGVGTTGLFWENVSGGQYWWGSNNVLYNANPLDSNFGRAINDQGSDSAADGDLSVLRSESNQKLIAAGAAKLVKEYGFSQSKARVVASALNTWGVSAVERGYTTPEDIGQTFQTIFGVSYNEALSAVQDLLNKGDKTAMKNVTNRTAAALDLKPEQVEKFIRDSYGAAAGDALDGVDW